MTDVGAERVSSRIEALQQELSDCGIRINLSPWKNVTPAKQQKLFAGLESYIVQFRKLFSSYGDIDAFAVSALRIKVLHCCANFTSTEDECSSPVVDEKENTQNWSGQNKVPSSEHGSTVSRTAKKMTTKEIAVTENSAEGREHSMTAMVATTTPHESNAENTKAPAATQQDRQAKRQHNWGAETEIKRLKMVR